MWKKKSVECVPVPVVLDFYSFSACIPLMTQAQSPVKLIVHVFFKITYFFLARYSDVDLLEIQRNDMFDTSSPPFCFR